MMKFSTKNLSRELTNRLGLYLLIGIVVAVGFWFLLIRPTWAAAQESKAELVAVRAEIVELEELRDATEVLRANYAEIRERRDQILNLLPTQEEEERILLLLSEYATQSGVVLGNFVPQGAFLSDDAASGFQAYALTVNISGSYAGIVQFISLIEEGARFLDITGLMFSSSSSASDEIGVNVSLEAYYQTEVPDEADVMDEDFDG